MTRASIVVSVLVVAGIAAAAWGGDLPKLPLDYELPKSDGSPGSVTFSHSSHVDPKQPGCTRCHPSLFKMLTKGSTADGQPVSHKAMEQGKQCGTCHGKTAFGFDTCDMCHH